mmetsp:Transcript_69155/g.224282  ORF Transcript_69155/g.224282 Transcript_69155/m.224282 type:complete len:101 (-) Transcript_69155:31-333(-)
MQGSIAQAFVARVQRDIAAVDEQVSFMHFDASRRSASDAAEQFDPWNLADLVNALNNDNSVKKTTEEDDVRARAVEPFECLGPRQGPSSASSECLRRSQA